MLIFVLLLYYATRATRAVPLSYGLTATDISSTPPSCVSASHHRSLWDILWSCLATIFACTWVSVHPNIPHPDAKQWQITRHRLHLMFWALIAPELIVLWAMRQWYGAHNLAERFREFGWTKTHGYFAQMGGFMLIDSQSDRKLGIISPDNMQRGRPISMPPVLAKWTLGGKEETQIKVDFPRLMEEDILDRSKGDGLSKTLVVVQTSWFGAQCIVRWVQGLTVTELELVTLAFVALNGVIYFLWWNKPLGVRYGVPVKLLNESTKVARFDTTSGDQGLPVPPNATSNGPADHPNEWPPRSLPRSDRAENKFIRRTRRITNLPSAFSSLGKAVVRRATSASIQWFVRGACIYIKAPFQKSSWTSLIKQITVLRYKYMDINVKEGDMEISPLYAYIPDNLKPEFSIMALTSTIAVTFGAIHCAAWNFLFPSSAEHLLWRVCAITITLIPVLLLVRSLGRYGSYPTVSVHDSSKGLWSHNKKVPKVTFYLIVLLVPVYVVARLSLLVEAFIALRNLPPGAHAQIDWITFLPHI